MEHKHFVLLAAGLLLINAIGVSARECAPVGENCILPNCSCPDTAAPGGLDTSEIPQIVFLTFDDAITISNYPLYNETIFNRRNPNGAPIYSTYFVTHEYNDYQLTHDVWRKGHEIALHSITHRSDTNYWATINETIWDMEVCDQKDQLAHFARIPRNEIRGFRVPFLQLGGNTQFSVLSSDACDLDYDCSRPTRIYAGPNPAKLWPYTMDYDVTFQDCQNGPCPTLPFPGFWTVPMVSFFGDNGFPCAMVDTCLPQPTTRDETFQLLKRNFENHHNTNKAPFGVYTHAAWLQGEDNIGRYQGYNDFLDYLDSLDDVYIVSIARALEWLKDPVTLTEIKQNGFAPWGNHTVPPNQCSFSYSCQFADNQTPFPGERYMSSCVPCPRNYPWLGNPLGNL